MSENPRPGALSDAERIAAVTARVRAAVAAGHMDPAEAVFEIGRAEESSRYAATLACGERRWERWVGDEHEAAYDLDLALREADHLDTDVHLSVTDRRTGTVVWSAGGTYREVLVAVGARLRAFERGAAIEAALAPSLVAWPRHRATEVFVDTDAGLDGDLDLEL